MLSVIAEKFRRFWLCLFLIPVTVLTAASLFMSEEFALHMDVERLIYEKDHPLLLLILFALFLVLLAYLKRFSARSPVLPAILKVRKTDRYIVMIIAGLLSLFFLLVLRSEPYMDCRELIAVANRFSRNDFSDLSTPNHDSYLYIYAFQIGMIGLLEILFRLFGENNFFLFQLLNVIFAAVMAGSIHEIAATVLEDDAVLKLTDLFLCFCFPLYINVTFVYGDVIGWSLACCALMMVFRWVRDDRKSRLAAAAFFIAAGVLIKSNDYIFLIAMVIILAVESVRKKDRTAVLFAVLWIALTVVLTSSVKNLYAKRAGINAFPSGAPATCWIAMSMTEHRDFEDGWYNGYNISTFVESGFDPVIANETASEKIKERLSLFAHHPKYAARFFLTKFVSAWNDPQFNSQIKMEWSTRHVEDPYPLAVSMVEGTGRKILFHMMNVLHFFIFAGTLIRLIWCVRRDDEPSRMTAYLILPVLGGMSFHLLWETQARYMIPYYALLFPAASAGILSAARHLPFHRQTD